MDLNINISLIMDKESNSNEGFEHRIVRVPDKYRKDNNIELKSFLNFTDKCGKMVAFQVEKAFVEDALIEPNSIYVTSYNFNELFVKGKDSENIKIVDDITLGCDPELFLVNKQNRNLVAAYRFFRKFGEVGNDGLLLELRPEPDKKPENVCKNLYNLILKANTLLNRFDEGRDIEVIAGSSYNNVTAGFHLHYGIPNRLLGKNKTTNSIGKLLTTAFDYYIGVLSIIPEGNKDNKRRTLPFVEYGKPGDFRLDNRTFEYRLPGAINMQTPQLAIGLMTLGLLVVKDFISKINTFTNCFDNLDANFIRENIKKLYPNLPEIEKIYEIICNPYINQAKEKMPLIVKDLREMVDYDIYENILENYFEYLEVFSNEKLNKNVKQNWGAFYNA